MTTDPFASLLGARAGTAQADAADRPSSDGIDNALAARQYLAAVAANIPAGASDDDVAAVAFRELMNQFETWHGSQHEAWTATSESFAHALAGYMRDMPTLHLKTAVATPGKSIERALRNHLNIPVQDAAPAARRQVTDPDADESADTDESDCDAADGPVELVFGCVDGSDDTACVIVSTAVDWLSHQRLTDTYTDAEQAAIDSAFTTAGVNATRLVESSFELVDLSPDEARAKLIAANIPNFRYDADFEQTMSW